MYEEYKNNLIDDAEDWGNLKEQLKGKDVLLIAPGPTVKNNQNDIKEYISENSPVVIGVNFIPEAIKVDYAFFSNNKRFSAIDKTNVKTIVTSNLPADGNFFRINYNQVAGAFTQGCNSFIMALKLMKNIGVGSIAVAGADGYKEDGANYYNSDMKSPVVHGNKYNLAVADAIHALNVNIKFITPSEYNK